MRVFLSIRSVYLHDPEVHKFKIPSTVKEYCDYIPAEFQGFSY